MTPPLIGLYSPAPQSGKSTIARHLASYGYNLVSFASPLKRMVVSLLLDLGYSEIDAKRLVHKDKAEHLPEVNTTPRHILQTLGTEFGRDCVHPHLWVMCAERAIKELRDKDEFVVIDDCRYVNEAALIRKLGGQMWHICRPGTERNTEHASEGSLDDYAFFDAHLVNNGTLTDLYSEVHLLLNSDPSPAAA